MSNKLSKQQTLVLQFVKRFKAENDYSPTYREIGDALGLSSSSTVSYHLQQLAAKGYVRINEGRQRAITLVKKENE